LDAHGNLLVADYYNKRVVVFNAADGEYVAHFPTPSNPYFVFVDSQGNVVVSGGLPPHTLAVSGYFELTINKPMSEKKIVDGMFISPWGVNTSCVCFYGHFDHRMPHSTTCFNRFRLVLRKNSDDSSL
jgi:hypothetical protein